MFQFAITVDRKRKGFTKEQAEQINAQLSGGDLRNSYDEWGHKRVKVDGKDVYVAILGGAVELPYLTDYNYRLTGNPAEILHFREI